ncbi:MAG: polysaccharide pyruvyl transferase family protein [Bacilli bacterium]|nr:polysaccharide pyruvyl transferase family protein [Bacilli bacterium]
MKYAVIMYLESDNIGDDIQTYATLKYLPRVDYVIDREEVNNFTCNSPVKAILNGWFMFNNINWPPSENIDVLPISIHFATTYFKNEYEKKLFEYRTKKYFSNFNSIGCRDVGTSKYLSSIGINNYISKCLTLTLDRLNIEPAKEKYICAVDLDDVEYKKLQSMTDIKIKKMSHDYRGRNLNLLTFEERMKKVEEFLKIYQNAYCVVTTRYHAALPSIALGTPVILIPSRFEPSRYDGLEEYVNLILRKDFISEDYKYDFDNLKSNSDISEIKKSLENACYQFINDDFRKINYSKEELEDMYVELLKKYESLQEETSINKKLNYYTNLDLDKYVEDNLE